MKWLWPTIMFPFSGMTSRIAFSSIPLSITVRPPIMRVVPKHGSANNAQPRTTGSQLPVRAAFTEASLLEHIRKLPHARATFKQLVRELGLQGERRDALEDALDRLVEQGKLVELRSGHFVATGANPEYVAGRISVHRDGFGFLIPDQPLDNVRGDVFLPPGEAAKAMHGDRALVHITRLANEGRAEGEIIRILRRAHITVVGEFRIRRRGNFVIPSDDRIQQWIAIPEGMEMPPHRCAEHRVGAAAREVHSVEDLDGMIVNVEILEFPENGDQGVGRVLEILG